MHQFLRPRGFAAVGQMYSITLQRITLLPYAFPFPPFPTKVQDSLGGIANFHALLLEQILAKALVKKLIVEYMIGQWIFIQHLLKGAAYPLQGGMIHAIHQP